MVSHVLRARYGNLYALLRDNIGEEGLGIMGSGVQGLRFGAERPSLRG